MRRWRDLVTACNIVDVVSLATLKSIVRLSRVVKIEKPLDPLTKLQVVLIPSLDELVDLYAQLEGGLTYVDVLLDAVLVEGGL